MGQVLPFAPSESPEDAWSRYAALVELQRRDERLLTDLNHQLEVIRAHKRFAELALREGQ